MKQLIIVRKKKKQQVTGAKYMGTPTVESIHILSDNRYLGFGWQTGKYTGFYSEIKTLNIMSSINIHPTVTLSTTHAWRQLWHYNIYHHGVMNVAVTLE